MNEQVEQQKQIFSQTRPLHLCFLYHTSTKLMWVEPPSGFEMGFSFLFPGQLPMALEKVQVPSFKFLTHVKWPFAQNESSLRTLFITSWVYSHISSNFLGSLSKCQLPCHCNATVAHWKSTRYFLCPSEQGQWTLKPSSLLARKSETAIQFLQFLMFFNYCIPFFQARSTLHLRYKVIVPIPAKISFSV